jgi:hypothetical protein
MKTLISLVLLVCLSNGTKKESIDYIEVMYYRYLPDKDLKKADCIWYASIDRFGHANVTAGSEAKTPNCLESTSAKIRYVI